MRLGEGGENGRRVWWVKGFDLGGICGGVFLEGDGEGRRRGSVPTACAECYADFWRERVSILYMQ